MTETGIKRQKNGVHPLNLSVQASQWPFKPVATETSHSF